MRTAAVTGAGGGLGREVALKLGAKGYRVFGTALRPEEISELEQASAGAVTLTVCDITDETAVKAWAQSVTAGLGQDGLDVLVSNAGILTPGPLEVLTLDEVRREFDVNVFGSLSVINAFLPALRKARGRIVEIGAMTGRFPIPFDGPSSASKAAAETEPAPTRVALGQDAQQILQMVREKTDEELDALRRQLIGPVSEQSKGVGT